MLDWVGLYGHDMIADSDTLSFWRFGTNAAPTRYDPSDSFTGSSWLPKWYEINQDTSKLTVSQGHCVQVYKSDGTIGGVAKEAGIISTFRLTGDFDVQVDFDGGLIGASGNGMSTVLGIGFGAATTFPDDFYNGSDYARMTYVRTSSYTRFQSFAGWVGAAPLAQPDTTVTVGKLRITRTAALIEYFYDVGAGWVACGSNAACPLGDAVIFLGSEIQAAYLPESTAYLRHFAVNSSVGYYPHPLDAMGNHHAVLWGGSTAVISGALEQALDLTVGTGQVTVPPSTGLDFVSGDFTIEAWVQRVGAISGDSLLIGRPRSSSHSDLTYGMYYDFASANYFGTLTDNTGFAIPFPMAPVSGVGVWQHLAIRRDSVAGTYDLFDDGVLFKTTAFAGSIDTTTNPLCIGFSLDAGVAADHIDNLVIDEIRVSSIARTDYEIQEAARPRVLGKEAETWALASFPSVSGSTLGPIYRVRRP